MMTIIPRYALVVLLAAPAAFAQEAFTVTGLDGTARVQRSQKRSWEKCALGDRLDDNDLVETFFQTKLILQFGAGNVVIVGSNSKALLNIADRKEGDRTITDVNLTLFSGGVFAKGISNAHLTIYTANAVGEMDSGSVSAVAEGKTGETGFQALGGTIDVRNIAQKKGVDLRSGLTTMIQPNKEPTAPLYITRRHVAVLQHYFGDEYITGELESSGIKPTDERSGREGAFSFSAKPQGYVDEGMHRPLFSLGRIYGSILDDRMKNEGFYRPIAPPFQPVQGAGTFSLFGDLGFSSRDGTSRIVSTASYRFGEFGAGARLSLVKRAHNRFVGGFSSLPGIMDKINYLSYNMPDDPWSLYAGPLFDITFGYGLIVDRFTNAGINSSYHPLGFTGHLRIREQWSIKAFTSDVVAPWVSGIYATYTPPSPFSVGAGYAADFNQYLLYPEKSGLHFVPRPSVEELFPDVSRNQSRIHCYMLDFTVDIIDHYALKLKLAVEFAQKLFGGNDGFVLRMPSLIFDFPKTSFGLGAVVESGRLVSGQFDSRYLDNRYRIKSDVWGGSTDSVITPNNILSRERQALGGSLFFRMNPFRGIDIDLSYKQDIIGKRVLVTYLSDSLDSRNSPPDFSYRIRGAVNDSLVRFLRYVEVLVEQGHVRLYPATDGKPLASWTFVASYNVLSIPLFFNIAFETGGRFVWLDTARKPDNRVDLDDGIVEFSMGATWGFK